MFNWIKRIFKWREIDEVNVRPERTEFDVHLGGGLMSAEQIREMINNVNEISTLPDDYLKNPSRRDIELMFEGCSSMPDESEEPNYNYLNLSGWGNDQL